MRLASFPVHESVPVRSSRADCPYFDSPGRVLAEIVLHSDDRHTAADHINGTEQEVVLMPRLLAFLILEFHSSAIYRLLATGLTCSVCLAHYITHHDHR